MNAERSRQRLNVFLLHDVENFKDALEEFDPEEGGPKEIDFLAKEEYDAKFFWTAKKGRTPDWLKFLSPALSEVPTIQTASSSGLIVLRTEGEYFALTFGYGRSLLDQTKIVRRFGLMVALNTIDPDQIRSLDTKTYDELVVAKNTQASRSTRLSTFDVDTVRDILRTVTGGPREGRLGKRVSGSDSVVLNLETTPSDLGAICRDLLSSYRDTAYKRDFGWVDDLSMVDDRKIIGMLDDQLVAQLRFADTAFTHMSMPDVLEWQEVDSFKIAPLARRTEFEDLDLDEYLALLPDISLLTVDSLKSRAVQVRFARSQEWHRQWNVYQCLVSEQRLNEGLYALIEGQWYGISESLSQEVDTYAASLQTANFDLPVAFVGEPEADYNKRLAAIDPSARLCLDANIFRPAGATSGIEVCDVILSDGTLVHVKRKSRSSTLSHLFAQGLVSITTLLAEGEVREKLRAHIEDQAVSLATWNHAVPTGSESPDRSRYTVAYVVLASTSRTGNNWLPFFSKLNLMQAAKTLRSSIGVDVSLTRVDVSPQQVAATVECSSEQILDHTGKI